MHPSESEPGDGKPAMRRLLAQANTNCPVVLHQRQRAWWMNGYATATQRHSAVQLRLHIMDADAMSMSKAKDW